MDKLLVSLLIVDIIVSLGITLYTLRGELLSSLA